MALLLYILVVVIIIIVVMSRKPTREQKRNEILKYESPALRDDVVRAELFERKIYQGTADDLFTRALILLREKDDLEDIILAKKTSPKSAAIISQSLDLVDRTMRKLMAQAVETRHKENAVTQPLTQRPLYHDGIIEQRAIELQAIPIIVQPKVAVAQPQQSQRPRFEWATDLQNVHDSTLGADLSRRLAQLKANDLHILDTKTCIGTILFAAKKYNIDEDKKQKMIRTLDAAKENSHCARYDVDELEVLRIVLERGMKFPQHEENLQRALIDALVDSSQQGTPVCLVGRISRYLSSLTAVDPEFVDSPELNTDAYRALIFAKLGQLQAERKELKEKDIDDIMAEYRERLPQIAYKIIRDECIAAIA